MELTQTAVTKRITIVSSVGTPADGDSLAGQNVNNFPEGALFFVEATGRMYELRKNLDALVVATGANNVVDGVGSDAAAGRFVALTQWRSNVTLTGGSATGIAGFDLSRPGFFVITLAAQGGTPGFVHATVTDAATLSLTSSSGSDTSTYWVARFN